MDHELEEAQCEEDREEAERAHKEHEKKECKEQAKCNVKRKCNEEAKAKWEKHKKAAAVVHVAQFKAQAKVEGACRRAHQGLWPGFGVQLQCRCDAHGGHGEWW